MRVVERDKVRRLRLVGKIGKTRKDRPVAGHMAEQEEVAASTADPCALLAEEIEAIEEQVALLEEGLSLAPGAQRAALAKEINQYREELSARRRALRQCRGACG